MRILQVATLLGVAMAAAACTDVPTQASLPPLAAIQPPTAGAGAERGEGKVLVRYRVTVNATGSLKPGSTVRINTTVVNTVDDAEAEVSVLLPELALARPNMSIRRRDIRTLASANIAPDRQIKRPISKDGSISDAVGVTIPEAGLYRVTVRVRSSSAAPSSIGGVPVQDVSATTLWLHVDEKGGRVLDRYDASVLPETVVKEPGAARKKIVPIRCEPDAPDCAEPPPPPPPAPRPAYPVLVTYNNFADGGSPFEPLRGAAITVADYGVSGGITYSGQTDANGQFMARCPANPNGAQRITVRLATPGQFRVEENNGSVPVVVDVVQPNGFCAAGSATQVAVSSTDDPTSFIHQQFFATVGPSRTLFGSSRGELGVNFDRTGAIQTSYYTEDFDYVVFAANSLYGSYGRFTASHEYGHALAATSLGGTRAGGCPSPHYFDGAHTMQCALSEGWADYFAARVRGPALGGWYYDVRSGVLYRPDGSLVEGSVASFLYAISAPANESQYWNGYDLYLHYPATYVAETMWRCGVGYTFGHNGFARPGKTDELVWCFERAVDQAAYTSGYFPTRDPQLRQLMVGTNYTIPANWSRADVRRVWLAKFYAQ